MTRSLETLGWVTWEGHGWYLLGAAFPWLTVVSDTGTCYLFPEVASVSRGAMRTGREQVHYSRSGLCTPNLWTWLGIKGLREDLRWGCTYNFQCSSLQHSLFRAASVFKQVCPWSCYKHLSEWLCGILWKRLLCQLRTLRLFFRFLSTDHHITRCR
jgi:hypothetical protein